MVLIQSQSTFKAMIERVRSSPVIILDTETNKTETLVNRYVIGVSVGVPVNDHDVDTWYIPIRHDTSAVRLNADNVDKYWLRELNEVLPGKTVIFHNIKFDTEMLENEGFDFSRSRLVCTAIWSHLHYEEKYKPYSHKLDSLEREFYDSDGKAVLKAPLTKLEKHMKWHQIPPEAMAPYAEHDCVTPWWLYQKFLPSLEEQELLDYYWEREVPFMECLKHIERRGVLLNRDRTIEFANATVQRMHEVQQELGFDPNKRIALARKLYAEPPVGLGLPVRARGAETKSFPQGFPTMNEQVLSTYAHPVVGLVLEYRGLGKQLSTYLQPWLNFSEFDGRIHPNFKQIGTVTGRLSCEHPNLQQIPRDGYLKSLFHAPPNYRLIEFDYGQMEFRLGAIYADEQTILTRLREGEDFHQITADLLGIPRPRAKNCNFAFLYGAGPDKFVATSGVSGKAGYDLYDTYRKTFPRLAATLAKAERAASSRGWIKNWAGRRRHFLFPSQTFAAFNAVIQGGAFEIVKSTMLKLEAEGYSMVNQIHDAVWIELPSSSWQQDTKKIKSIMEDWVAEEFGAPFPVDIKELKAA